MTQFRRPSVPGLEFVDVGQSSQMQSINGVTSSTTSETYQVIPQRAGKFNIPALSRGSQALVLFVRPGGAPAGNNSSRVQSAAAGRERIVLRANEPDAGRRGVRAAALAEA